MNGKPRQPHRSPAPRAIRVCPLCRTQRPGATCREAKAERRATLAAMRQRVGPTGRVAAAEGDAPQVDLVAVPGEGGADA